MVKDFLEENYISRGSLVFIYHREKPEKTGWWRKLVNRDVKENLNNEVVYVLEKPLHKDFNLGKELINKSRIENNTCVMKSTTVAYSQKNNKGTYELLCEVSGSETYSLIKSDYSLKWFDEDKFFNNNNIKYTERFEELVNYYQNEIKNNELMNLSKNLI